MTEDITPLLASRAEVAHLHAFFLLLAQGHVAPGSAQQPDSSALPIAALVRIERDGERRYEIAGENVIVRHATRGDIMVPRADFREACELIVQQYRAAEADVIGSAASLCEEMVDLSALEGFLDYIDIFDLQAHTEDRTAFHVQLYSPQNPLLGVRLQSALGCWLPLLDGGRTANIKMEQTGVRFSQPGVQKINALGDEDEVAAVARRILYIESHGGTLRYNDIADRVFRSNLMMLDTNMGRILCTMLRALHLDGVQRITDLAELLEQQNPLKVKDELVRKHGFYRYKIHQLLLAAAWGMRPAKQWTGVQSPLDGYLVLGPQLQPMLFTRQNEQAFADFLMQRARLEQASPREAHYGLLERENGAYYLKLNLKIGLSKR